MGAGEKKLMDKELKSFGIAGGGMSTPTMARTYTYEKGNKKQYNGALEWPSTKLIHPGNPFNNEIFWAKNILEIGCGCGRNLPWVMEATEADYWGVDPNYSMTNNFWELNNKSRYGNRTHIYNDFVLLPDDIKFDVVFVVFVFQHLGFRAPEGVMNVVDITREAMKHTRDGTIWWVFEHEREEPGWVDRWIDELSIDPEYHRKDVDEFEYLNHRARPHTLVIFKEKK